jgi:hypothetical protein
MDPAVGGAAAGVGLGLPALLAWRAAYGGYAGVLDPLQALELLQTQEALLVDVRRLRDPAAVALQIQALEVAALAKLSPGSTRVIVMDQQVGRKRCVCDVLGAALGSAGTAVPRQGAGLLCRTV